MQPDDTTGHRPSTTSDVMRLQAWLNLQEQLQQLVAQLETMRLMLKLRSQR